MLPVLRVLSDSRAQLTASLTHTYEYVRRNIHTRWCTVGRYLRVHTIRSHAMPYVRTCSCLYVRVLADTYLHKLHLKKLTNTKLRCWFASERLLDLAQSLSKVTVLHVESMCDKICAYHQPSCSRWYYIACVVSRSHLRCFLKSTNTVHVVIYISHATWPLEVRWLKVRCWCQLSHITVALIWVHIVHTIFIGHAGRSRRNS